MARKYARFLTVLKCEAGFYKQNAFPFPLVYKDEWELPKFVMKPKVVPFLSIFI